MLGTQCGESSAVIRPVLSRAADAADPGCQPGCQPGCLADPQAAITAARPAAPIAAIPRREIFIAAPLAWPAGPDGPGQAGGRLVGHRIIQSRWKVPDATRVPDRVRIEMMVPAEQRGTPLLR